MEETVHFSVQGKYISDLTKNMVLEGNWSGALRILSADNPDKYSLAIKILSGDMKLSGYDNEIVAEEDNDREYKEELKRFYAGLIFEKKSWYKPYRIVNTITKESKCSSGRSRLYMKKPHEDISLIVNGICYLFEKTDMPPVWFQNYFKERSIEDSFLNLLNLETWGVDSTTFELLEDNVTQREMVKSIIEYNNLEDFISYDEMEEEIAARKEIVYKMELVKIRKKVLKQSKTFITLKHLKIPKEPFLLWLNHSDPGLVMQNLGLKYNYMNLDWKIISPRGFKMIGDDPAHTDWVIGAGLDPDTFYDSEENKMVYRYISNLRGFSKMFIKLHGTGVINGQLDSIENANENSIVIVPTAGVEYFELAKRVKAVIAEVGGPAAHLAVNAAEHNIHICVIPNASKILEGKTDISLDFNVNIYESFISEEKERLSNRLFIEDTENEI